MSSDNPGSPPPPESTGATVHELFPTESRELAEELETSFHRHPAAGSVREVKDNAAAQSDEQGDKLPFGNEFSKSASDLVGAARAELILTIANLEAQLAAADAERDASATEMVALRRELDDANEEITDLEKDQANVQQKLERNETKSKLYEDMIDNWKAVHAQVVADKEREIDDIQNQVDQLEAENADLREEVGVDDLTGLAKRRRYFERLQEKIDSAHRSHTQSLIPLDHEHREGDPDRPTIEQKMAVAIRIDLDKFGLVNKTLGHQLGDALLQYGAYRLKNLTRADDLVARVGGDEFAAALEVKNDAGAQKASLKIRLGLRISYTDLIEVCRPYIDFPEVDARGVAITDPDYFRIVDDDDKRIPDANIFVLKYKGQFQTAMQEDAPHDERTRWPMWLGDAKQSDFLVTASVGVCVFRGDDDTTAVELDSCADHAATVAKHAELDEQGNVTRAGRNRVVWHPEARGKETKAIDVRDLPATEDRGARSDLAVANP